MLLGLEPFESLDTSTVISSDPPRWVTITADPQAYWPRSNSVTVSAEKVER